MVPIRLGKHVWMSLHSCFLGEINTEISGLWVKQIALQNVGVLHPRVEDFENRLRSPKEKEILPAGHLELQHQFFPRSSPCRFGSCLPPNCVSNSSTSISAYVHMSYWFFLWRTLTHTGSQHHCMWLSPSRPSHTEGSTHTHFQGMREQLAAAWLKLFLG